MRRRAVPGITPLLEQAKLTRIVCCRRSHARRDARPPFLAWLLIHIDDMHRFPNEFIASKGSLRQQAHQDVRIVPPGAAAERIRTGRLGEFYSCACADAANEPTPSAIVRYKMRRRILPSLPDWASPQISWARPAEA